MGSGGLLDRVGGILDGKTLFSDGKDAPAGEAEAKKGGLLSVGKHCVSCEVRVTVSIRGWFRVAELRSFRTGVFGSFSLEGWQEGGASTHSESLGVLQKAFGLTVKARVCHACDLEVCQDCTVLTVRYGRLVVV